VPIVRIKTGDVGPKSAPDLEPVPDLLDRQTGSLTGAQKGR
jgi:hypothetical protein